MQPYDLLEFCPRCGQRRTASVANPFRCAACGLVYYFNPAVAVGAILLGPDDRALLVKRAQEPAKGKLGLPGGFVDFNERAEEALRREVREEVNLELASMEYVCSAVNHYAYAGVTYPVLDLFFAARAASMTGLAALDGVESYCWIKPAEIRLEDIAFPSMRQALQVFNRR
jgi:ADP-ribose pyrophosphatase YjhB (NUDIX family)